MITDEMKARYKRAMQVVAVTEVEAADARRAVSDADAAVGRAKSNLESITQELIDAALQG